MRTITVESCNSEESYRRYNKKIVEKVKFNFRNKKRTL